LFLVVVVMVAAWYWIFVFCVYNGAVAICGVLWRPFSWPETLVSRCKSSKGLSLWIPWILLGKVMDVQA
jgi:hypothetical protein